MIDPVMEEYFDIQHMFMPIRDFLKESVVPSDAVIVYPPTIDWNWMKQRPQQIMEQFARHGHEVYYCEKTQSNHSFMTRVLPNLTVVHDNVRFIKDTIPRLKRSGRKIILWVSWSKLHLFVKQYIPDFIVYDYVDDIPEWAPYLDKIVNLSNIVITSAGVLQDQITNYFPDKPVYKITNGCDIHHFQKYSQLKPKKPRELEALKGPVVGFVGAWAHWVDEELFRHLAKSLPDVSFVIIGVEFAAEVDRSLPNVHYLGYKPYHELPNYLYYFDACLIPFKVNRITTAANPIKMYEYLACGKPVIATNLPETNGVPNVFTAENGEEYKQLVQYVLSPNYKVNRTELQIWLEQQTWEDRYRKIKWAIDANWPKS